MISDRIREFGETKYSSMSLFAESLGLSPQGLNKYITGKNKPGVDLLIKLIGLGANIYYILTGEYQEGVVFNDNNKDIRILREQLKSLNIKNNKLEGQVELLTALLKKEWRMEGEDAPRLRHVSEPMPVYKP